LFIDPIPTRPGVKEGIMSRHGVPVPPLIYPAAFSGVPILILDNFGLFVLPVAKPIRRSGLVPVWDTRCSQLG
jgi:hypothetical protein